MKERERALPKKKKKKKNLRLKFQDSLCAIEKDEVDQQSAKGILREERFFSPPGGKKIKRWEGAVKEAEKRKSKQNKTKTGIRVLSRNEESWEDHKGVCAEFH